MKPADPSCLEPSNLNARERGVPRRSREHTFIGGQGWVAALMPESSRGRETASRASTANPYFNTEPSR
jgi:hypothetical protein